jgi:predicted benzoate:H+ symporter BenE
MDSVLVIGFGFVICGGALTAFHLLHLFGDADSKRLIPYRIAMALVGGLCISIGANLIATTIHDKVDAKY